MTDSTNTPPLAVGLSRLLGALAARHLVDSFAVRTILRCFPAVTGLHSVPTSSR